MKRGCVAVLLLVQFWSHGQARAEAQEPVPAVAVIVVPVREARTIAAGRPSTIGVGVNPGSRSVRAFMEQILLGAPNATLVDDLPPLIHHLRRNGVTSYGSSEPDFDVGLAAGSRAGRLPDPEPRRGQVFFREGKTCPPCIAELINDSSQVIVLGVGVRTPIFVAVLGEPGVLEDGIARRLGVITPYDISALILEWFELPVPDSVVGQPPKTLADASPIERVDRLGARFVRDARYGVGLTIVTVVFGLGALLLAFFFAWRRKRTIASALLGASAMAPAGYVGGLFIPHEHWVVRSIGVVGLCAIGAGVVLVTVARRIRPQTVTGTSARAFCGWVILGTAAAIALLAIAAALRPNGEPALSLWGDPLVSWRFFGLRNHLAAFIAGGAIVGSTLLGFPLRLVAAIGTAALFVVGAPKIGANFIGVTTLAFGVGVAMVVAWRKRFEWWHLFASGAFALGATFLAFLSDVGSPVSHGGRAAQTISSGGIGAAWDIFAWRARLNYREVIGIPVPLAGPIAFVALTIILAGFLVWAYRAHDTSPMFRAAIAGGSAAAFAALFIEDSGFFTGGILALYPGIALVLLLLLGDGARTTMLREQAEPVPPLPPRG